MHSDQPRGNWNANLADNAYFHKTASKLRRRHLLLAGFLFSSPDAENHSSRNSLRNMVRCWRVCHRNFWISHIRASAAMASSLGPRTDHHRCPTREPLSSAALTQSMALLQVTTEEPVINRPRCQITCWDGERNSNPEDRLKD